MNLCKKILAVQCSVLWVVAAAAAGMVFYYSNDADWSAMADGQQRVRARIRQEKEAVEAKVALLEHMLQVRELELQVSRQSRKIHEADWRANTSQVENSKAQWERSIRRMTAPAGVEVAPQPTSPVDQPKPVGPII